ncbi:hypothetical protein DERF_009572 [Dermatophagoides farinae]|uniref:Uncharacterized protein n=1 Tax=Dermatophagoides farinae TaxID=6954 RepID=A0A922L2P4_DERFA|nr:hypothetical protein DERF_009572 [Dermatophagoides farinae]
MSGICLYPSFFSFNCSPCDCGQIFSILKSDDGGVKYHCVFHDNNQVSKVQIFEANEQNVAISLLEI